MNSCMFMRGLGFSVILLNKHSIAADKQRIQTFVFKVKKILKHRLRSKTRGVVTGLTRKRCTLAVLVSLFLALKYMQRVISENTFPHILHLINSKNKDILISNEVNLVALNYEQRLQISLSGRIISATPLLRSYTIIMTKAVFYALYYVDKYL